MSTLNFTQSTVSGRYRTPAESKGVEFKIYVQYEEKRIYMIQQGLTSLGLEQEAVDGAGGTGHVGQRDLPQESING